MSIYIYDDSLVSSYRRAFLPRAMYRSLFRKLGALILTARILVGVDYARFFSPYCRYCAPHVGRSVSNRRPLAARAAPPYFPDAERGDAM